MNFYRAAGYYAILALNYMHFFETELCGEELCAPLYVKRRENGDCRNEFDGRAHTVLQTPNVRAKLPA